MNIIRKVTVKQILTEESKGIIQQKLRKEQERLKKECQQLLFEQKKLERARKLSQGKLTPNFMKETEKRNKRLKAIEFQLEQLDILPLGTEIIEGQIEALLELHVGDQWSGLKREIIIENGIVKEIREG